MKLIHWLILVVLVGWFLYALVTTVRVMRRKMVSEGWNTLIFIGVAAVSCFAPLVWIGVRVFGPSFERPSKGLDKLDSWIVEPEPERPAPLETPF